MQEEELSRLHGQVDSLRLENLQLRDENSSQRQQLARLRAQIQASQLRHELQVCLTLPHSAALPSPPSTSHLPLQVSSDESTSSENAAAASLASLLPSTPQILPPEPLDGVASSEGVASSSQHHLELQPAIGDEDAVGRAQSPAGG